MSRKEEAWRKWNYAMTGRVQASFGGFFGPAGAAGCFGHFGRSYVEVGFVQGGAMKLIVMLGIVLLRVGKVCERVWH
jgi:hypothetical protein